MLCISGFYLGQCTPLRDFSFLKLMDVLESRHSHFFLAHLKTFWSKRKLWLLGFVMTVRLQRPEPVVLKWKSFSLTSVVMPSATWPGGSPLKAFVKQHIVFPLRKTLVSSSRNRDQPCIPMGKERVVDVRVPQCKCILHLHLHPTPWLPQLAPFYTGAGPCRCEARPW